MIHLKTIVALSATLLLTSPIIAHEKSAPKHIQPPIIAICELPIQPPKPVIKQDAPNIEVCFVIDTTGSMSSLIKGAKDKIYAITNQILQAQPAPNVKIALVAYRDKNDAYITKSFDLNQDIDTVYTNLATFQAQGGGDTPEHVNKGLHDALNKITWSKDKKTLRIIYLVGDCPPHNEYQDTPQYQSLTKTANAKGIYINTVLCGNNQNAKIAWLEIANATQGAFMQIGQSGGVQVIATPFDKQLSTLNTQITGTVILYGSQHEQTRYLMHNEKAGDLGIRHESRAADRALNTALTGHAGKGDLLNKLGYSGRTKDLIKLEELEKDKLSPEMKKMTPTQQKAYIKEKQAQREKIITQIKELNKKRTDYISKQKEEQRKQGKKSDSFDDKVLESLKKQAKQKGIKY